MAKSPAPSKVALYFSLIGIGAIVPIAINPMNGRPISFLAVVVVAAFIWSDIRADRNRRP
jgi:hypothetical protein